MERLSAMHRKNELKSEAILWILNQAVLSKAFFYNKDGTVDYVFDDTKLNEVIAPFENKNDTGNKSGQNVEQAILSRKENVK